MEAQAPAAPLLSKDEAKPATVATAAPKAAPAAAPAAAQQGDTVLMTATVLDTAATALSRTASVAAEGDNGASSRPAASKSDAVLADAVVVDVANVNLGDRLVQLLQGDELQRRFEEIQRRALEEASSRRDMMSTSIVATGTLSIGYVVWLVRGGVLMSSMLSALPAWQMIDPLPVLAATGAARARRQAAKADEGDVERLFDEGSASRAKVAKPARTPAVRVAPTGQSSPPQPVAETAGSASAEDLR